MSDSSAPSRILAFDIGIKNLAWCCLEKTQDCQTLLGWDNQNLLAEGSNVVGSAKVTCQSCKLKACFSFGTTFSCARHCPPNAPALRDVSGTLLKKLPSVAEMKAILTAEAIRTGKPGKTAMKKPELVEALGKIFSLPIQTQKVSRAPDVGLTEIHTAIQKLVRTHKDLWSSCHLICLENQPVLKNPTMKSVQILLFGTLRDLLNQPPPQLKLVHAGKKVKGAATGDAGQKDRKAGSEMRAQTFLNDPKLTNPAQWKTLQEKAVKKSDLADALAMCIDHA